MRALSGRLLTTQEQERKRIAGELHDSIGSSLSAIKFSLEEMAVRKGPGFPEAESLKALIGMTQHAIDESRRIITDLRPSILDDLGITATIDWFSRHFRTIYSRIRIEDDIAIEEERIPESLKIVIFRIVQEAFHNIAKYSRAERVNLLLRRREDRIELLIRDNGVGFDPASVTCRDGQARGLGLTGMRERAELSGGTFSIDSVLGEGASIRVTWPDAS